MNLDKIMGVLNIQNKPWKNISQSLVDITICNEINKIAFQFIRSQQYYPNRDLQAKHIGSD